MSTTGDRPPITIATLTAGLLWPRLWRTLPMATRPGRLIIAFIMVVTLQGVGQIYDEIDTWTNANSIPAVPGAGLDADHPDPERVQSNLRGIVANANVVSAEYAQPLIEQETITPTQVRTAIERSFRDKAKQLRDEAETPIADVVWDRVRTPYASAIRDVELLRGAGLYKTISRNTARAFNEFVLGAVSLDPGRSARAADWWWSRTIVPTFTKHTTGGATLLLLFILIVGVFGGAIARSAACDTAGWPAPGPGEAIRFAWKRRFDFMLALLGPSLFILVVGLVLALIGAVALRIPGIDVVASVLYGLALLMGLLVALCVFGLCLGGLMLIPSVSVECSDWLDGVQRVYAYVAGAPGRLVMYLLALLTQGALAYWALSLILAFAMNFTANSITGWLGSKPTGMAGGVEPFVFEIQANEWALSGTSDIAAHVMGVWELAAVLLLAAGVLSYLFTGGTLLYLALRQVNDHQDMADISPELS